MADGRMGEYKKLDFEIAHHEYHSRLNPKQKEEPTPHTIYDKDLL